MKNSIQMIKRRKKIRIFIFQKERNKRRRQIFRNGDNIFHHEKNITSKHIRLERKTFLENKYFSWKCFFRISVVEITWKLFQKYFLLCYVKLFFDRFQIIVHLFFFLHFFLFFASETAQKICFIFFFSISQKI